MANNIPIFPGTLKNYTQTFVNTDSTTVKVLATGGTNGTKIESVSGVSTDITARVFQLYVTISGINYPIGEVSIPTGAGTNGGTTKAYNVFNSTDLPWMRSDENGRSYIYLASGATLTANAEVAITAAKQVTFFSQGGDF